jgi:hypothetical protein
MEGLERKGPTVYTLHVHERITGSEFIQLWNGDNADQAQPSAITMLALNVFIE